MIKWDFEEELWCCGSFALDQSPGLWHFQERMCGLTGFVLFTLFVLSCSYVVVAFRNGIILVCTSLIVLLLCMSFPIMLLSSLTGRHFVPKGTARRCKYLPSEEGSTYAMTF